MFNLQVNNQLLNNLQIFQRTQNIKSQEKNNGASSYNMRDKGVRRET